MGRMGEWCEPKLYKVCFAGVYKKVKTAENSDVRKNQKNSLETYGNDVIISK